MHTAITQKYSVTTSELSKLIFKPMIHAAFQFYLAPRQKSLLPIFFHKLFLAAFVTTDQKLETLCTTENVHHIFTLKLAIVYYILISTVRFFSSEIVPTIYIMPYIEVPTILENQLI